MLMYNCICTLHRHVSPSDITAIQDALLHKCMDHGRVVHIVVDKRSLFVSTFCVYVYICSIQNVYVFITLKTYSIMYKFYTYFLQGCVYIKLDSISTALSVYKTLHGSWFNGK